MKKLQLPFLLLLVLCSFFGYSQNSNKTKPNITTKSTSMRVVSSLESKSFLIPAKKFNGEVLDRRYSRNVIVSKKGSTGDDLLVKKNKTTRRIMGKAAELVFESASSNISPSDPSGAVGLNHYVAVFNTGFRVFDKNGTALTGQLSPDNIFSSGSCCDLTISYDNAADRWVMSILYVDDHVEVAVSQTENPVTTAWSVYSFSNVNDYQKLSVWSDGYYMTANVNSSSAGTANSIFVLERDEMLAGNTSAQMIAFPLPGISTSGFYSPQVFNVSNNNLPATGNAPVVYMQDDAWAGVSNDHLKLWEVNVDWTTPGNSTVSNPTNIPLTDFISVFDNGSFSNLQQPFGGVSIDALQAIIMNQAQFRKFPSHNSAVFNFVVDVDGTANKRAGIRWIELRQSGDGQPWSLYQEGTYTSPDGKHAWNASLIMDVEGNIGMGYVGMGGTNDQYVSSYYTGRLANDPLGTMTIPEETIDLGTANIPNFRYSDYSKIDIDPSNDKKFWYVTEYMKGGSERKNVVGVFQISPDTTNDVGVVDLNSPVSSTLGNNETVTITIYNYGQNSASNFDVSYQVDGNTIVTETFTNTINAGDTAQFTFTQTVDLSTVGQTYNFVISTNLTTDENNANDSFIIDVTNLEPNDIGVTNIVSPISGINLTATEQIIIEITNFGGVAQSNFDVTFDLNGTSYTETVTDILNANSIMQYTFTQTGDFSAIGNHNLSVTTNLSGDADISNDQTSVVIQKSNCEPTTNCSFGDGFRLFQIGTINNTSDCEIYGDFTHLITDLETNSTNALTITTNFGNQNIKVWVDFNDDFLFTNDEIVVQNYVVAPGATTGPHTETVDLIIPTNAQIGEHLMRAKSNFNATVPDDACADTIYGETEDYMVNITYPLNVGNDIYNDMELLVFNNNTDIFEIMLNTQEVLDNVVLTVYNSLGQQMVYHRLTSSNDYKYTLDMSYVASGVYLIKVGNTNFGKIKRIIVK